MPSADHELDPQELGEPSEVVHEEPSGRSPEHAEPSRFLPHVQGLRAIAVLFVVLYHFWPGRITGGYVGVDIFFVISGFLITSHLMREYTATGSVKLGQFWARRARRLLPASLLVLLVCAVVAMSSYLMPIANLRNEVTEIIASAFYVENWRLALSSADYLNHTGDPTTVQHYWSLSLEEQFYLMWPLLILLAGWFAAKRLRGNARLAVVIVLGAVSVLSFIFCVWFTATNPAPAYFVTFGRMWQFGLGAMVALIPALRLRNPIVSFVVGWVGILLLLRTCFVFDGQTTFPGYNAAFPAVGAAAVIAAMNSGRWFYPARVLGWRPMQFIGGISYSLYLWHWPLLIIAPSTPFWVPSTKYRLALLVLCFLLAWLTKKFVEDPVRRMKPLTSRAPRVTLISSLVAMLVVAGAAGGAWAIGSPTYQADVQALKELRDNPPHCFGAASVLESGCEGVKFGDKILPAPGFAGIDQPADEQCFLQLNDARPYACQFGSNAAGAKQVVLIGDSHAFQLLATFQRMATENGWHLTTYLKGACPWNTTPISVSGAFGTACENWRAAVTEKLKASKPDVVFTASLSTTGYQSAGFKNEQEAAVSGYQKAWKEMTDRGIPVVTVVDNPGWENDPNKCLRTHAQSQCTGLRSTMLDAKDPVKEAAQGQKLVTLLDFTKVYCDEKICWPVVGGANIYRDFNHLTVTFADTLKPQYTAAIKAALGQ